MKGISLLRKALAIGFFALFIGAGTSAHAATISFAGTSSGGNSVDATATFTPGAGTLTIDLVNNVVNQTTVGQNISDLSFTVFNGATQVTGGSLTSSSGLERTV